MVTTGRPLRSKGAVLFASKCGDNQRAIASRLKVSQALIARWKSGERTPKLENRELLRKRYGIPIEAWNEPPESPTAWGESAVIGHVQMLEALADRLRTEIATSTQTTGLERIKQATELAKLVGEIRRLKGDDVSEVDLANHPSWIALRNELLQALERFPDALGEVVAVLQRREAKSA